MKKLGIVTCQILELEFAHVLSNDPGVSEISVIGSPLSEGLVEALKRMGVKKLRELAHLEAFSPSGEDGLAVLVEVMKLGLHSNIQVLQREIKAAVQRIARHVDAVLLGYGLCGNALMHADELFSDIPVPVHLPVHNGEPVDDCVGLIIGGRDNYYEEQRRCAGTMFMNAGFARHWDEILSLDVPEKLMPKKDKLLRRIMGSYQRTLLLPTPVMGEEDLRENTRKFSEKYGLRTEVRSGSLSLLEQAWDGVKKAV